jgi:hypothetical protein
VKKKHSLISSNPLLTHLTYLIIFKIIGFTLLGIFFFSKEYRLKVDESVVIENLFN